jgi:hypothetical protein
MPLARSSGFVMSAMYALAVPRFAVAMPPKMRAAKGHGERRAGDRPEEHRPAADAVRDATPHRDEEELHQRVDGAEERGDERADAERVARFLGEEREDEPEPEEVDEDREEDGAEARGWLHGRT